MERAAHQEHLTKGGYKMDKKLTKKEMEMAERIWATQRKYPMTEFVGKDFTYSGNLTNKGRKKIKKKDKLGWI